ncbi:26S proteasome non-ATPase regulatory subunit 1 [Thecamonas trahens ATCC 50062]|uniref:26S proteasome non-ATPase regulatory subunit 1 n=1 Tax=Thecamonas trahens ATCC 50062 TaxID=461836 RepID=A0A0L0DTX9_THETB|nr:26S proteasome non-ATPase regulatory subunit 1 [Thecamonas trahens ATCC 50062]KNC55789.1 26S proteasome non-ATPase regulatory subunit 1 [Thecamonas trahens ATCC 50062]|eukprot:XP_013752871.1 26S proteasome non-ATPase regulatory subunit 1 [Thecamonas trahens ATCC 50062]
MDKVHYILTGEPSIEIYLQFLYNASNTDPLILEKLKEQVANGKSVLHSGVVFANSLMCAGTTSDAFLHDNMEWLSKATHWARFNATASLGVIHKGHLSEGLSLLAPYLPAAGQAAGSPYSEGGALYGLGIINANHGAGVSKYLLNALRAAGGDEVVLHGAALGLGVASMATHDNEAYTALFDLLNHDQAVAGEAAGVGMGLVMLGSADADVLGRMLAYARQTQHEKIIRGVAMGIALLNYGREERADVLIDELMRDKDALLRYGGMYTIAMAYCGTSNNRAVRKLLRIAVSDVSDDVRRAAVTALGFVLFREPTQIPKVVSLLSASYNPHVRHGAAMALGIGCAGTALPAAVELLEPLLDDTTDFVRQGALIALAMVLVQSNEKAVPKVTAIREKFLTIIGDKHEDVMAKFGALLAAGIIDAGGRNVTISCLSRDGHNSMSAIVGLALFTQFWYWYPYIHMISLAFLPTAVIGLDANLQLPVFSFKSNAPPSAFAYPPRTKVPEAKEATRVDTYVLSVTSKAKARGKDTNNAPEPGADAGAAADADAPAPMDTTSDDSEAKPAPAGGDNDDAAATSSDPSTDPAPKPEPAFELLENPARVTLPQAAVIDLSADARYTPVKASSAHAGISGIILLEDSTPDLAAEYVQPKAADAGDDADDGDEPPMPEPFEWIDE